VAGFQREWFAGVEHGLRMMRDQLQSLIKEFGQNAEGTTVQLTQRWTAEVETSLKRFGVLVQQVGGHVDELTAHKDRR